MATVSFEHGFIAKKSKNRAYYFKKKKKQLVLEFDEKAREEFLTGFRKRKLQRKKKAVEDLEAQLKQERKRIRQEAKNAYKKLVVTYRDIPDLKEMGDDADIVDMDTHEVQVTELDPDKLARENNWIGANRVKYEEPIKTESEEVKVEVEGMSLKTEKDVKKFVKNVATKTIQRSKIFQKKRDADARRNKKLKRREERSREKLQKKNKRRN